MRLACFLFKEQTNYLEEDQSVLCHSHETISRDLCNLALLESWSYEVLLNFSYMCTKEVKCEIASLKGKFGLRSGAEGHNELYSMGKNFHFGWRKREISFHGKWGIHNWICFSSRNLPILLDILHNPRMLKSPKPLSLDWTDLLTVMTTLILRPL